MYRKVAILIVATFFFLLASCSKFTPDPRDSKPPALKVSVFVNPDSNLGSGFQNLNESVTEWPVYKNYSNLKSGTLYTFQAQCEDAGGVQELKVKICPEGRVAKVLDPITTVANSKIALDSQTNTYIVKTDPNQNGAITVFGTLNKAALKDKSSLHAVCTDGTGRKTSASIFTYSPTGGELVRSPGNSHPNLCAPPTQPPNPKYIPLRLERPGIPSANSLCGCVGNTPKIGNVNCVGQVTGPSQCLANNPSLPATAKVSKLDLDLGFNYALIAPDGTRILVQNGVVTGSYGGPVGGIWRGEFSPGTHVPTSLSVKLWWK